MILWCLIYVFVGSLTFVRGQLDPFDPVPSEATDCDLNIVNLQLSRFDYTQDIFVWSGWISTVCEGVVDETVEEFIDLSRTEGDDGQQTLNSEKRVFLYNGQNYTWSTVKIWHKFHWSFDLASYPFTQNLMTVSVECNNEKEIMRWRISPKNVSNHQDFFWDKAFDYQGVIAWIDEVAYPSRFGLPPGVTNDSYIYDRLNIQFNMTQSDMINFIQGIMATYVAMLMALLALLIPVATGLDARLGLLAGALFVVVLNIASFNQFLGFQPYLTTGDIINVVTMVFIGVIVIETVVEKVLLMRGRPADVRYCFCGLLGKPDIEKPKQYLSSGYKGRGTLNRSATVQVGNNAAAAVQIVDGDLNGSTSIQMNGAEERRKQKALDIAFAPGIQTETDAVVNADDLRIPFYYSMSFWTFALLTLAYFAINIGLLVGYRAY